jgi:hypothetical protein
MDGVLRYVLSSSAVPCLKLSRLLSHKHQITGYLAVYYHKKTKIHKPFIEYNKQEPNIKFATVENNYINFLDLTIHRKKTKLEFTM